MLHRVFFNDLVIFAAISYLAQAVVKGLNSGRENGLFTEHNKDVGEVNVNGMFFDLPG